MATLRQLEALIAVIDQGTFESAARSLGIAQSAVSRLISELESWLGYPLFERNRRTARPTQESIEVVVHARKVLMNHRNFESCLRSNTVLSRKLRVGVTELSALTWFPNLVSEIRKVFPRVAIEPEIDQSVKLVELLHKNQLDLIVVPDAFSSAGLIKTELTCIDQGWYGAPSLVGQSRHLPIVELSSYPLLSQGNFSGVGLLIREWLKENHVYPSEYLPCNSLVASIGLAISALGVAYIPRSIAGHFIETGRLSELIFDPLVPPIKYVVLAKSDTYETFHHDITSFILNEFQPGEKNSSMDFYYPRGVNHG